MRIGVVVDNEFDQDHRVQKQVKQLLQAGHSVFVLCFDFGNTYKAYTTITVERITLQQSFKNALVMLNTRFSLYEKLWSKHITKFIATYNLQALHSHDLYLAKASKKGIKLTLDLHENYPAAINSYQWATKGWRKFIVNPKKWYTKEFDYLNCADFIITLSDWFSENLKQRFPTLQSKLFVSHPNLPDFKSFQAFENKLATIHFSPLVPTLFYFGVVAKRRGIIDILPWLETLLQEGLQFHLLIIGPTDKADNALFKESLKLPKLNNNSTYLPWADISLLPAYLNKIAIGLAPFEVNSQHNSGVANKLYQYMYGSVPILATACKAQKELIVNTNCGLIYSHFESFKTALIQLLENDNFRKELGSNGKKELLRLYESGADQKFLNLYE